MTCGLLCGRWSDPSSTCPVFSSTAVWWALTLSGEIYWKDVTIILNRCSILTPRLASESITVFFVVDSVCLYVCHGQTSSRFFFFASRRNRAIFGRQFSMWHSTERCSSVFDLGPLTTEIYSPQIWAKIAYKSTCTADRPEMFAPIRGFSGMADSMVTCKVLWGRPLLPWQRHLG